MTQMKTQMKTLTRVRLINWHYFTDETIDIKGSALFTGDNASGKSTILDAIQMVDFPDALSPVNNADPLISMVSSVK